jgi:hypothetical protein
MNRLLTFLYKKHWFPYVGSNANKSRYFRKILEHLFNPYGRGFITEEELINDYFVEINRRLRRLERRVKELENK